MLLSIVLVKLLLVSLFNYIYVAMCLLPNALGKTNLGSVLKFGYWQFITIKLLDPLSLYLNHGFMEGFIKVNEKLKVDHKVNKLSLVNFSTNPSNSKSILEVRTEDRRYKFTADPPQF